MITYTRNDDGTWTARDGDIGVTVYYDGIYWIATDKRRLTIVRASRQRAAEAALTILFNRAGK